MTSVATNFSRGAGNYARSADFQREIAEELFHFGSFTKPQRLVEIGCGTGFLSQHYATAFPDCHYTALDIAPGMIDEYRRGVNFGTSLVADGEGFSCPPNTLDGIVSSSTIQWFSEIKTTLENYKNFLQPGGQIVISTFGPDFFREFRSCAPPQLLKAFPHYYAPQELTDLFREVGFEKIESKRWIKTQNYPDAKSMLRNMNQLGFGPLGSAPLEQGVMRRLLRDINARPTVELSYDTIFIKAIRPA